MARQEIKKRRVTEYIKLEIRNKCNEAKEKFFNE